jgi:hypothetical protein
MPDFDDDLWNTVIEVPHWFEIELNVLVKVNHRLTIEGIARLESEEIAKIRKDLEREDRELVDGHIRFREAYSDEMRRAAHLLALVGLVTRFQHRIKKWLKDGKITVSKGRESSLIKRLRALNDALGDPGPVPVQYFEDLLTARDSAIHGDSQAYWRDDRSDEMREVATHYRNGSELEVSEEHLSEAFAKTIAQVKWYDERLA